MTQEERVKKALDLLNGSKTHYWEESYGPDCRIYERRKEVVSIDIAKRAIEIATGKKLGL